MKVEVLPVVQPGPSEVAVVKVKTQRPHQPERRARGDAGPADRTGVGRDLGLDEDHVEGLAGAGASGSGIIASASLVS